MIFSFFRRATPSEEPRKRDDCCPVCGVSFAMYPEDEQSRQKIIRAHVESFHPEFAEQEMIK
jgi:hypothetical protein